MSPAGHPADDQLDAAIWCRHLVPQGSVHAFLADHRHDLFPPELFADVARQGGGHPSVPAEVVATVMVLQALEGLSDREAISALRRDIAWKVACGLRLDDEGFHPTVLVYWRNRLRASPRPRRIFDAVRQVVEAAGVLRGRRRRVLDSTILEDAVATQDTVTQLVAAVRRVRRLVPQAREVELGAHDYDLPGKPECAWDDPQARHARKTSAHKRDGYKAHIATEPETGLVTECALTAATAPDGPTGVELLADEDPGLEVLGDTHYGSGETRAALRAAGHLQTIKPIPLHSAVPGGFTVHDFQIDQQAGTVRCPAGYTTKITASGQANFARRCQACPLRGRCTTARRGRILHIHPHERELRAARRRAVTRSFQQSYRRWRPMVERSLAWLVADGCRRVPYRGVQRNQVWWSVRVAAVNLRRLLVLGLARHDGAWVLA